MPKNKWIRRLGAVLLMFTCFGFALHRLFPSTMINATNAGKVQLGMTSIEVFAILGGPPRDEATGPIEYDDAPGVEAPRYAGRIEQRRLFESSLSDERGDRIGVGRVWTSDTAYVCVSFDLGDFVRSVQVNNVHRVQNGLWDSIRSLVERLDPLR